MIELLYEKGSGNYNEDCFGSVENRYWIFDGVTAITEDRYYSSKSDSMFLVQKLTEKMLLQKNDIADNISFLKKALRHLQEEIPLYPFTAENRMYRPSFAMAMVQIIDNQIEMDLLSDCYVIVKTNKDITVYTDYRIRTIRQRDKQVQRKIKEESLKEKAANLLQTQQIYENRKEMNRSNGYWVGTLEGEGIEKQRHYSIPKDGVEEILICSDGFYRLFEYLLLDMQTFFFEKYSLQEAFELLRTNEKKEYKNKEYKKMDDVTALRICF